MKPALKTTPLRAIPEIDKVVRKFGGSLNGSVPDQWRKGIGIHRIIRVQSPMREVKRFGWNPKGRGYTASSGSTLMTFSSSSGICSYAMSAATSGSDGRAAYTLYST